METVKTMATPSRKSWIPGWAKPNMPSREQMAGNKWLAPIAHRFLSPELWRFTRRSVPRGVALGFFCAFIVPVGQVFLAAFMALPSRANVPLAAIATFLTNPLTFPFWIVIANKVGNGILKIDTATGGAAQVEMASGRWSWLIELFEAAGIPVLVTVFGFIVLAVVSSALGWVISSIAWRFIVARKRARRLRRMERALDHRLERDGEQG